MAPVLPLNIISKEFLIDVNGVFNSCDTIDINSDLSLSSFANLWFLSIIS